MKIEILNGSDWVQELLGIVSSYRDTIGDLGQQTQLLVAELSENGDNRTFFLGRLESTPVAMVQIIHKNADNDPELANGRNISHVHGLRVHKDFTRRGLAKKMMDFVEDHSRSREQAELTLGVDDWNSPALNLYSSLGYEKFKQEPGRTPEEVLFLLIKEL